MLGSDLCDIQFLYLIVALQKNNQYVYYVVCWAFCPSQNRRYVVRI